MVEVRRTLVSLITVGSGLTTVVVLQLQTVITGMAAVMRRRSFIEVVVEFGTIGKGRPWGTFQRADYYARLVPDGLIRC